MFVASYTGAWIETLNRFCYRYHFRVASYTGAWIETYIGSRFVK